MRARERGQSRCGCPASKACLVREISDLVGLEPKGDPTTANEAQAVCARLHAAGYRLRPLIDAAEFAAQRRELARCIIPIAESRGTPEAPLLP